MPRRDAYGPPGCLVLGLGLFLGVALLVGGGIYLLTAILT